MNKTNINDKLDALDRKKVNDIVAGWVYLPNKNRINRKEYYV